MGVWIETVLATYNEKLCRSHPSWVCGLKLDDDFQAVIITNVTPFVGVWIETWMPAMVMLRLGSHTLRGCVD